MSENEHFTAYVTKYALTTGIRVEEAELRSPNMIAIRGARYPEYFHGLDWHLTMADAVVRAEQMRVKKLESIEKQAKRLRALKFATAE